jgi:hypothetical protein
LFFSGSLACQNIGLGRQISFQINDLCVPMYICVNIETKQKLKAENFIYSDFSLKKQVESIDSQFTYIMEN